MEQKTKKCPYCAEEILAEAVKCKHCAADLSRIMEGQRQARIRREKEKRRKDKNRKIAEYAVCVAAAAAAIFFWYVSLPLVALWWLWFKSGFGGEKRKRAVIIAMAAAAVFWPAAFYIRRAPIVEISYPEDGFSVQAGKIEIRGKASPGYSKITVNGGDSVSGTGKRGEFAYAGYLLEEKNVFDFRASNFGRESAVSVTVNRIYTGEELEEMERQKAVIRAEEEARREAERKAEEEKERKELEAQREWERSKAGRICKAHPEWSEEDCKSLADNMIWIGMTLEMLKYERGNPDHTNVSNYGSGIKYQWCWHDYTPRCFYGGDDEIIDSYN